MKTRIKVSFVMLFFVVAVHADKKVSIDYKIEKNATDSLGSITVLLQNAGIYSLSNLPQAKTAIDDIIKSLSPFKGYDYITKAINYLKTAQKYIDDAYTFKTASEEDSLSRHYNIEKAKYVLYNAGRIIQFGEIPAYKNTKEERQDFYKRIISAKQSLNEALVRLKLKKPEIKEALKIVQQAKDMIKPFLRYQVINHADIFLTVNALKYLNRALEGKDRLEKERNVQHAIVSIVYATGFLDDAEKDLKEIIKTD